MGYLLIGCIFILFDFWIPIGIVNIGVLPEFIGWILICKGVKELKSEELFDVDKLELCIKAAVIVSTVSYIAKLFGISAIIDNIWNLNIWINFMDIAWIIFTAFIIFTIIRLIIKEIEINGGISMLSHELEIAYIIILICKLILSGVGFVPGINSSEFDVMDIFNVMATVGIIVAEFAFLFLLYKARKNYIEPK